MSIFINILSIIAIVLGSLSIWAGVSSINNQNKSTSIEKLREYIRKHQDAYGVTGYNKTADTVKPIRVLSPSEIGITEI